MLKRLMGALVLGAAFFVTGQAAAQMPDPAPPAWPTLRPPTQSEQSYYGLAQKEGRQIANVDNRCLTVQALSQNAPLAMQACASNLATQRFVIDKANKMLRLAPVVMVTTPNRPKPPNLPPNQPWPAMMKVPMPVCLTANDAGDLRVDVCKGQGINPAHQNWEVEGDVVHTGPFCLDIAGGNKANGAKVIAFRCNGGGNQSWRNGQNIGAFIPTK